MKWNAVCSRFFFDCAYDMRVVRIRSTVQWQWCSLAIRFAASISRNPRFPLFSFFLSKRCRSFRTDRQRPIHEADRGKNDEIAEKHRPKKDKFQLAFQLRRIHEPAHRRRAENELEYKQKNSYAFLKIGLLLFLRYISTRLDRYGPRSQEGEDLRVW